MVMQIILIVLASLALVFTLAYFTKPELLTLPYTAFLKLFVSNPPIVDLEKYFPEYRVLEDNWETIREECLRVLQNEEKIPKFHEVDSIQKLISAHDEVPWRTFGIKAFDRFVEPNASLVPKTRELLEGLPRVNLAMFSILGPGKRIPRHFGFFKGIFRYHLGLIVPEGECYIINGGEKYYWKEGESVLFDDTYFHEVWNNTEGTRVVFFADVYRDNSLPKWLRPLNRHMTQLLASSKRVRDGVKKAEVTFDVGEENKINQQKKKELA